MIGVSSLREQSKDSKNKPKFSERRREEKREEREERERE